MRTTLNLDEKLFRDASRVTGITEKTAVIHRGLEALIELNRSRRLALLGATQKHFKVPRRRRSQG